MSSTGAFSLDEVKAHKGENWVAIHGKVYDLHAFKADHPGGKEVIEHHSGTDATKAFDQVGHPKSVGKYMEKYQVGSVKA